MSARCMSGIVVTVVLALAGGRTFAADGPVPGLPWLHEGLAITYAWYAAVAPGNGSDYQEDEHGDWVNPTTGKHYSRTTQQGTSGNGLNQATIACIEDDKVVMATQLFGNAGPLGNNVPVPLQGGASIIIPVAQATEYWIDPGKLALMRTDPATGTQVSQVSWPSGDSTVDATRIQIISGGSYSLRIYDAKTGQCLHYATSSRGAAPKMTGPGDMGQGDVTLTSGDLVAQRDLAIPWAKEPTPDWLSGVVALHYRGSMTSRGALPTVPNQLTLDLTLSSHGKNWALVDSVVSMQMQGAPQIPPTKAQIAFGRAQFSGLWVGPAVLGDMTQGQVLDEDPLTKIKTVVAKVSEDSIIISQQNAGGEMDSQYDRGTGMLTGSSFVNVLSQQQLTVRLVSRE